MSTGSDIADAVRMLNDGLIPQPLLLMMQILGFSNPTWVSGMFFGIFGMILANYKITISQIGRCYFGLPHTGGAFL